MHYGRAGRSNWKIPGKIKPGGSIMATNRQIGILTGGGDVPGLNAVIKSVVYQTTGMGYKVLGIRRGWEGLTHLQSGADSSPAYLCPLDRNIRRNIGRTGGTM